MGKPFLLNFRTLVYTKPIEEPYFQKQNFNKGMKRNQNLPKKQVRSNNMTSKLPPFLYCSRCNSRDNQETSRHRSPNKSSIANSRPYYGNHNSKPPSKTGSPYPRSTNFQKINPFIIVTTITLVILDHIHLIITEKVIAHGDNFLVFVFEKYEITLFHF